MYVHCAHGFWFNLSHRWPVFFSLSHYLAVVTETCSLRDSVVNSSHCTCIQCLESSVVKEKCFGFKYFVLRWNPQLNLYLFSFFSLNSSNCSVSLCVCFFFQLSFWNGNHNDLLPLVCHSINIQFGNKQKHWIDTAFLLIVTINLWYKENKISKDHLLYFLNHFETITNIFSLWKCKFNDESRKYLMHDQ